MCSQCVPMGRNWEATGVMKSAAESTTALRQAVGKALTLGGPQRHKSHTMPAATGYAPADTYISHLIRLQNVVSM